MASWVDDVVPAPGRLLAELYRKLGPGANGLMKGTASDRRSAARLPSVAMPVLSVSAEKDTIAPPAGVDAIRQDRAARRSVAVARRACRHRRRPSGGRRCGSARWSFWARRGASVERSFIHWRGHRICVSEQRQRQAPVSGSRHRLQRRHVGAVHEVLPESAARQLRRAGRRTLEHAALSRLRRFAGDARRRRARQPRRRSARDVVGFSYGGADRAAARLRPSRARPPPRAGRDELRLGLLLGLAGERWP